jgi:hypothetical protein
MEVTVERTRNAREEHHHKKISELYNKLEIKKEYVIKFVLENDKLM